MLLSVAQDPEALPDGARKACRHSTDACTTRVCCSVKRHGYPVGGMRSESPVKKQAATEEMHLDPQHGPGSEKAAEKEQPKKAARGRPKKTDS